MDLAPASTVVAIGAEMHAQMAGQLESHVFASLVKEWRRCARSTPGKGLNTEARSQGRAQTRGASADQGPSIWTDPPVA